MPKKPRRMCLACGKAVKRAEAVYCSNHCQQEYSYQQYIEDWKLGKVSGGVKDGSVSAYVRRYLEEKLDNRCAKCGWSEINPTTGRVPLQVHHIGGDWANHCESNLELLCPNCHSLTPNYGPLNKGNGRSFRMEKYEPNGYQLETNMVTLACSQCGTSFERRWSNVGSRLRHGQREFYCSSACASLNFGKKRSHS